MDLNPRKRNRDPELLHPLVREAAQEILRKCEKEELSFRIFEGYRTPERQKRLYNTVREVRGKKFRVTRARAWRSLHQYGVAVDFVLWIDNKWSWSTRGECAQMWKKLHEIGAKCGLEPLSFEKPHMQVRGVTLKQLVRGEFPPEGDESWALNIVEAKSRFPQGSPSRSPAWRVKEESRAPFTPPPHIWEFDDCDIHANRPHIYGEAGEVLEA